VTTSSAHCDSIHCNLWVLPLNKIVIAVIFHFQLFMTGIQQITLSCRDKLRLNHNYWKLVKRYSYATRLCTIQWFNNASVFYWERVLFHCNKFNQILKLWWLLIKIVLGTAMQLSIRDRKQNWSHCLLSATADCHGPGSWSSIWIQDID